MKNFLNTFMSDHRDGKENEKLKKIFKKTSDAVLKNLGEKPFRLTAGLNAAVFDSVFVSFSKFLSKIPNDIKERYKSLIENKE